MPEWSRVSSAGGPFGIYRKLQNAYTRISSVRPSPKKDGRRAEAQYAPTACPVRQKKDDRQAATSSRGLVSAARYRYRQHSTEKDGKQAEAPWSPASTA